MEATHSRGKHQRKECPSLPEDIFFHILIWLPADILHHCARFVCKTWANIISDPSFIKEQLKCSKSVLFIQTPDTSHHAIYLNSREREFEMGPVNTFFHGQLISTAKGVSLFHVGFPQKNLYVGNLVTGKFKCLPYPITLKERFSSCHLTLVPQSWQYKVLCCIRSYRTRKWRVFTLGIDQSWRNLEVSSMQINLENKVEKASASVGGVIYLSRGRGAISAIDLNLETNYLVEVPDEFVDKPYWLCEMGNNLSCGVNQKGEVHIYMLKDLSEWVKMYKLVKVVDKKKFLFRTLVPVGWLRNGEIFVFIIRHPGYWMDRHIVAYDVKTGEKIFHKDSNSAKIHIHTNSLISW